MQKNVTRMKDVTKVLQGCNAVAWFNKDVVKVSGLARVPAARGGF